MEHSTWKSNENWTENWCHIVCSILFGLYFCVWQVVNDYHSHARYTRLQRKWMIERTENRREPKRVVAWSDEDCLRAALLRSVSEQALNLLRATEPYSIPSGIANCCAPVKIIKQKRYCLLNTVMVLLFFNRWRAENSTEKGGISQTPGASDADGPRPQLHAGSTSHGNGRARGARAKTKWVE